MEQRLLDHLTVEVIGPRADVQHRQVVQAGPGGQAAHDLGYGRLAPPSCTPPRPGSRPRRTFRDGAGEVVEAAVDGRDALVVEVAEPGVVTRQPPRGRLHRQVGAGGLGERQAVADGRGGFLALALHGGADEDIADACERAWADLGMDRLRSEPSPS